MKFEAKNVAAVDSEANASANATLMQQMVKAQPVKGQGVAITSDADGTAVGGWSTRVVPAKPAR